MIRKISLLFFLFQIKTVLLFAQPTPQLPRIIPASPEASALAKYINFPVNYGTGQPEISIPLYEIKTGDITLPISISYHASGIKVNEQSGWVGQGWTLNAEPQITRSIKGLRDEVGYLINTYSSPPSLFYYLAIRNGGYEEEPDEFYYKLLNKSGGFYFSRQPRTTNAYEIVTHPFEPIRLSFNTSTPYVFNATDENGLYYRFGTSLSNELNYEDTNNELTTWKATEIISSATKDTVKFKYHPFNTEFAFNYSDLVIVEDSLRMGAVPPPDCVPFASLTNYVGGVGTHYRIEDNGNLFYTGCTPEFIPATAALEVRARKINEISFKNGKVVFEKIGNRLTNIKIYNSTTLLRQIKFYQDYYNVPGPNTLRTKLDSLQVLDAAGNVIERYGFRYEAGVPPEAGPSKQTDYWGYYNGPLNSNIASSVLASTVKVINNDTHYTPTITVGAADKTPNISYMRAGILDKITYPTGGYTLFNYEINRYQDYDQISQQFVLKPAGGLRIASIEDYDPVTSKSIKRIFKYGINENGAGFIKRKPTSDEYMMQQEHLYRFNTALVTHAEVYLRRRIYYSNALTDLFYSDGPPIVYSQVAEYRVGSANYMDDLGKTIYKYNYSDRSGGTPTRFPGTTLSFDPKIDWWDGELLSREDFKNEGGAYVPVLKKSYFYSTTFNPKSIPVGKIYTQWKLNISTGESPDNFEHILYYAYTLQSGGKRLVADTTIERSEQQSKVTINSYVYGNNVHLYPTEITIAGSDGNTITQVQKYPPDLLFSIGAQKLYMDGRISTVLEQSRTKNAKTLTTKTDYIVFNNIAVPSTIQTNTGPALADEPRIQFNSYNNNGQVTSVSKAEGAKECYVYSYGGTYPIAKVENAEYSAVETALGGFTTVENFRKQLNPTDLQVNNFLAPLKSSLPNAMISTFTYIPLVGMTTMTDAKGLLTTYEYDSFQRLKNIKDQNGNIIKSYTYHYKP